MDTTTNMDARKTILTGAFFCFMAVAVGAFAAHGLKLEGYAKDVFETGVRYHFYHALGLLLVGSIALSKPHWVDRRVPLFLAAGILIFSVSLYILAITGIRWLGAITPFGGLCFLIGWLFFAVRIIKNRD
jgi:uncharacterized membrane protein YgdD (TMEM256/DUF423 family)